MASNNEGASANSQEILAIFVVGEGKILASGVPTIIAETVGEQEALAQEFAKFMRAWIHKLANGLIFVTKT